MSGRPKKCIFSVFQDWTDFFCEISRHILLDPNHTKFIASQSYSNTFFYFLYHEYWKNVGCGRVSHKLFGSTQITFLHNLNSVQRIIESNPIQMESCDWNSGNSQSARGCDSVLMWINPRHLYKRMLQFANFDVCEFRHKNHNNNDRYNYTTDTHVRYFASKVHSLHLVFCLRSVTYQSERTTCAHSFVIN